MRFKIVLNFPAIFQLTNSDVTLIILLKECEVGVKPKIAFTVKYFSGAVFAGHQK